MIIKIIGARQPAMAGPVAQKRSSDADLGRSMRNLISYLVGKGNANEHTNPTLVAGSEPIFSEFADARWDDPDWQAGEVSALAKQLNRPMMRKRLAGELPEDRAWVMHAVVSMEPGTLMDHRMWEKVARDYVAEMGLDGSDNKAPCRWVAFHHGLTTEGNDHIHIAIQTIREDGTWASMWRSKQRTQDARRVIENRYGLTPAEQAAEQRDRVPFNSADAARNTEQPRTIPAQDRSPADVKPATPRLVGTDNEKLRHLMVAALTDAASEADYVRNLWSSGVLARPRFADGTTEVIVGYSVALRPTGEEQPLWHAAGKVHKSLTLSNIRARFVDDPQAASDAAAMWRRVQPDVGAVPAPRQPQPNAAARAAAHVAEVNKLIADLDPAELEQWSELARDTAGVWAAAANQLEPAGRGPVSRAAEATWRDGTVLTPTIPRPRQLGQHQGLARAARLLVQASRHDVLGWLAVLEQLAYTNQAIAQARTARRDYDDARYLLHHTRAAVDEHRRAAAHTTRPATAAAPIEKGAATDIQIDRDSPEPER